MRAQDNDPAGTPTRPDDGGLLAEALAALDERKRELDALSPLTSEIYAPVRRKLRILADHHSSAIEGNTLTLGETAEYLRSGTRPPGKPESEVMEIRGHDDAVEAVEEALRTGEALTEEFLLRLHRVLMSPVVKQEAAFSGLPPPSTRPVGGYKTICNSVNTSRGEKVFTPPVETPEAMRGLLAWLESQQEAAPHAVAVAAEFHWRFVEIHPFYDGNGRMARLLMNLILRQRGYPEAVFRVQDRDLYLDHLVQADAGEISGFIRFIANYCGYAMDLYLRCGRGESIEEPDDIDFDIADFVSRVRSEGRRSEVRSARESAETLLFPFYRHFRSKLRLIFEYFEENDLSLEVSGVLDSGESFKRSFRERLDGEDLPSESRVTFVEASWVAKRGFANITVRGEPSSGEVGAWTWRFGSDGWETVLTAEESEAGAKSLKLQFNEELRRVLKKRVTD